MAIKDLVSGAWQDISTLKIPVNGAYQEASSSKALVSGAWKDVWTNAYYIIKNGVQMNVEWLEEGVQGSSSIYCKSSEEGETLTPLRFKLNSSMVGKKLYVRTNSNVGLQATHYWGYLIFKYPLSSWGSGEEYFTKKDGDLFVFDLTSEHFQESSNPHGLMLGNSYAGDEYHFYDIYVK